MPDINKLDQAPFFNPHRTGITTVDAADDNVQAHGVEGGCCERVIVDVDLDSGALTGITIQPMFWSDGSGKFVPDPDCPAKALTAPSQFTFANYGRRFWLKVTVLTGTTPNVSLSVAGAVVMS